MTSLSALRAGPVGPRSAAAGQVRAVDASLVTSRLGRTASAATGCATDTPSGQLEVLGQVR